ncbi:DNA polymerase III subunit gamma/tau, partial [Salmonella enterica]|nr:DNA polymerase III subunit gamma/tau [Salmonella enterica]
APVAPTAVMTPPQVQQPSAPAPQTSPAPLPASTSQVLAARNQLQRAQGVTKTKKSEPAAASRARPVNNSALERLALVSERVQARPAPSALETAPVKKEAYRWKATTPVVQTKEVVATPKALKKALEHEKTPELAAKLAAEAIERDPWAAQVSQLSLPKLVEQVALNAWKEQNGNAVCLHLRSTQRHLNSSGAQQKLAQALSDLTGTTVELTIVEDDNPAVRTPLEWRQAIYEEKLAQARESIIADNNIQTLRRFFDAELDEESIRPI